MSREPTEPGTPAGMPPPGEAVGEASGEAPRLLFGDADSLAFKEAFERESIRRGQERAQAERRERRDAERNRRGSNGPKAEEVLLALRAAAKSLASGLPVKRAYIEVAAMDRLRSAHPGITAVRVREVFDSAVSQGLLVYRRRFWEWSESDRDGFRLGEGWLPAAMSEAAAAHLVGIGIAETPGQRGFAVYAAPGGRPALVTTRRLWERMEAAGLVELYLGLGSVVDIDTHLVDPLVLGGISPSFGPDLALLQLPLMAGRLIEGRGKRPCSLSERQRRLPARRRLFALLQAGGRALAVFLRRRFEEDYAGLRHDYLDVAILNSRGNAMPGIGAALFSANLDLDQPEIAFEGIVFHTKEAEGLIRCHGAMSIGRLAEEARRLAAGKTSPQEGT